MEEVITLTMKEKTRYEVIKDSLNRLIKVKEVAQLLNLSLRQVYRLRDRVKKEGIKGVIHHLKGRISSKKTPKKIEEKIKKLYQEKYSGLILVTLQSI